MVLTTLTISAFAEAPQKEALKTPGRAALPFEATDAISAADGSALFMVAKAKNMVIRVDTADFSITSTTLYRSPDSLDYKDGELFVGFGANGSIAIMDAKTLKVKDKILTGTIFYDLAVGKDGYIYIIENFGSSAYSHVRSISRTTGQQVSSLAVYPRNGKLVSHPSANAFYYADVGVSPQDLNIVTYKDGHVTAKYDSPYHGDYSIGERIRISPDGKNIFTSSGNVFTSSSVQEKDMIYKNAFRPFADLIFDSASKLMFAAQNSAYLSVHDYSSYAVKGVIATRHPVKEMSLYDDAIIALSYSGNGYYLELLDPSSRVPDILESIVVEPPIKTAYLAGQLLDLRGTTVTARYVLGEPRTITDYTTNPAENTYPTGGNKAITVSYTENGITKTASFEIRFYSPMTVSVTTPTIVETLAAYLCITVEGNNPNGNEFTAYLKVGDELRYPTKITNGSGRMLIDSAPEAGDYELVIATSAGVPYGGCIIDVTAYNPSIWEASWRTTQIGGENIVMLNFIEKISLPAGGALKLNGKAVAGYTVTDSPSGDSSIITGINFNDLVKGENTFTVTKVKYPRLFPSFTFTFEVTINKP